MIPTPHVVLYGGLRSQLSPAVMSRSARKSPGISLALSEWQQIRQKGKPGAQVGDREEESILSG